jgi:hypothetical protein
LFSFYVAGDASSVLLRCFFHFVPLLSGKFRRASLWRDSRGSGGEAVAGLAGDAKAG